MNKTKLCMTPGSVPNASSARRSRQAGGAAEADRVPRHRKLADRTREQTDNAVAHR